MLKKSELIELVEQSLERNNRFVEFMRKDTNPQVVALVNDSRGRAKAFEDVLNALRGNAIPLRITANH